MFYLHIPPPLFPLSILIVLSVSRLLHSMAYVYDSTALNLSHSFSFIRFYLMNGAYLFALKYCTMPVIEPLVLPYHWIFARRLCSYKYKCTYPYMRIYGEKAFFWHPSFYANNQNGIHITKISANWHRKKKQKQNGQLNLKATNGEMKKKLNCSRVKGGQWGAYIFLWR